jgi:arsenite-transporting ATPase
MESLADLVADLEKSGHGVIMTMGKGGVGKTTVAAALAVALAQRGHRVHLSTTDPAAHLEGTLAGEVEGPSVCRIDPPTETANYRAEVMCNLGKTLDPSSLALLEEDLRSPCTEEIAVFRAFAREIAVGEDCFVVLDTAPTGHTLLLLDASASYQRELDRQSRNSQPEAVLNLLTRLRDPDFTKLLLVTLAEATPVHEAAALQQDLRRAGIHPFAWVVNRESAEHRYLDEIAHEHADRIVWVPWQLEEPTGQKALARLERPGA